MIASTESENALIGALLVDPSQIDIVTADLTLLDFADPNLGQLYDAITTVHESGRPVGDMLVLVPELRRMEVPDEVRNVAFLGRLVTNGRAGHARFYARDVRRASRLRQQGLIARELAEIVSRPDADPDQVASWLDAATRSVGIQQAHCRPVGEIAREYITELREPRSRQRAVMTGILGLDETVGGFMPGELIVLAARTGQGKTALGLQMASHVASKGRGVLFVSLEMQDQELVSRVLCGVSGVNSQVLRTGDYDDRDIGQLEYAGARIENDPLFVWDPPRATTKQIKATAKRLAAKPGLGMLIVDYVGLVAHPNPKLQKWDKVSEITRDLKSMAKELAVPVLALAQLNREADGNTPRLSHLRDSGSVEQDADVVLFIHRDPETTTLTVAKHRHAATGTIKLRWIAERTRFECGQTGYEELP